MRLAIIAGIASYHHETVLSACAQDAKVFKSLIERTKLFSDVCFLNQDVTGAIAKKDISEFVQKYKGQRIEELLFYFSGHGARIEDDFLFAFADFKKDRQESASLRNTELDGLIRNLAPELTIKVIDACRSGTVYIKSDESDITPYLEKSAKENKLNKLYFFHSSSADEVSWAGPKFSYFTKAFLESLSDLEGPVRYRDIMAAVADEMARISAPRPTFVIQADNTEVFVDMEQGLRDFLKDALGLGTSSNGVSIQENDGIGSEGKALEQSKLSIFKLAELKAKEVYCSESEANMNLTILNDLTNAEKWPNQLIEAFDLEFIVMNAGSLPNRTAIGQWIASLKDDTVFAVPAYRTESYITEEYREVPKKPTSRSLSGYNTLSGLRNIQRIFGEEPEYRLEKVENNRKVLSGFEYTVDPIFYPHHIFFNPKLPSLEKYAATVICLFSRRNLNILYAIEHLRMRGWNDTVSPQAKNWKQVTVSLKEKEKITLMVKGVMDDISDFVCTDAMNKLTSPDA